MLRALLAFFAILATACALDDTATIDRAVAIDPIQACPVPQTTSIAGHESDFYRCVDAVVAGGEGCGPDGYLLGYGARYAERFYRVTRPRMSPRGQRWIDDVLVCLQETMQTDIDAATSCDDIRDLAFDSHPQCYVASGFCTLPFFDIFHVVTTVDVRDWLGSSAARQAVETAIACGREYTGLLHLFFGSLLGR